MKQAVPGTIPGVDEQERLTERLAAKTQDGGIFGKTYRAAVDTANSESGQRVIKTGVGCLPGGTAAVKAYENKSQIQSALGGTAGILRSASMNGDNDDKHAGFTNQNTKDLVTGDAGQEILKAGVTFLPGGGPALQAYENGSKLKSTFSKTGLVNELGG